MTCKSFIKLGRFNENVTAGLIVPCLSPFGRQTEELLGMNGSREDESMCDCLFQMRVCVTVYLCSYFNSQKRRDCSIVWAELFRSQERIMMKVLCCFSSHLIE